MSESLHSTTAVKSSSDLPPPRNRKGIRPVAPPLSRTPLRKFNYYMALFAGLLLAFYAWRLVQWKTDVGGWWNLALGKRPIQAFHHESHQDGAGSNRGSSSEKGRGEFTMEERINELASALGMPSKDLASAIAAAVREHIPPASLSSISAHQTGEAVSYLVDPSRTEASDAKTADGATITSGLHFVSSALDAAVGLDEPLSGDMEQD